MRLVLPRQQYIADTPMRKGGGRPARAGVEDRHVAEQSRQIVDFGSIRMPHGNFANDLNYSSGFHLMANPISSGTWDLDFVCLMPATGVRHLKQIPSLNTVNNAYIADNSRDGEAYLYSSSVKYPVFEQYGSPLYVWPKKVNYLYFLTETTSGGASDPLLAMDVEVFYWPRRLTV